MHVTQGDDIGSTVVFSGIFGIWVKLRLYRFDWEKEESVVKQSAAAIGGFCPLLSALVCMLVLFVTPSSLLRAEQACICLALSLLSVLMYKSNIKASISKL